MGEGALAHVRLIAVGTHVGGFIDEPGDLGEPLQVAGVQARQPHLQLEVGDDGAEVGVAAALAHAVDGPLDLAAPQFHRGDGVGHGQFRIVVGVDSQGGLGETFLHRLDDLDQLAGQGAAVGVAQYQVLGPSLQGRRQGAQGVVPVFLEGVEEVLGVVKQLLHPGFEVA